MASSQQRPKNGGRREGAGRKEGAATKKTREIANRSAAEGITPLEVQIKTMRAIWDEAIDKSGKVINIPKAKEACEVGRDALPYMHARFASVDPETGKTILPAQKLDELEFARAIAYVLYVGDRAQRVIDSTAIKKKLSSP